MLTHLGINVTNLEASTDFYTKLDKFWAHDPDGNEWEFFVPKEDVESNNVQQNACCIG